MGNGCMRSAVVEVKSPTLPAFKVVVVGDSESGKTSIVRRFIHNKFDEEYTRTTDVDISSVVKKLNVPEHAIVTVELWDVPGENDVDLRKTYYLDVDAVIVVVDISSNDSLNVAGSWSLDVSNHARVSRTFTESVPNPDGKTFTNKIRKEYVKPKAGSIPVLLLGNKYDLAKTKFMKELEAAENEDGFNPTNLPPVSEGHSIKQEDAPDKNHKTDESAKTDNESAKTENDSAENKNDSTKPEPKHTESKIEQKADEVPTKAGSEPQAPEDQTKDVKEETSTKVANGHIGNGDITKEKEGPEDTTLKKIHPKDEKKDGFITNNESSVKVNGKIPSPTDDAKSAVTSIISLLPPCVEDIERVAEKYGFIAGVPVSAKTVNGGVQEAIQSILRRLVAKKLFNLDAREAILERKKQNFDVTSAKSIKSSLSKNSRRSKKKMAGTFEPLQEVGIIEIDEVIRRCNPTLHEAEDLTAGYAEAMHGFKLACFKNGFTSGTRVSLEVCITALKEAVATNFDPVNSDPRENIRLMLLTPEKQAEREQKALSLTSTDIDGFPDLRIVNTDQEDVEKRNERNQENPEEIIRIQPKIMNVLTEYREKFHQKSASIFKHGAEVGTVLGKQTMELTAKEEKAWETAVAAGLSHDEVRRILSTIAQDKARLRGTAELVQEATKSVRKSAGKIKATLLF